MTVTLYKRKEMNVRPEAKSTKNDVNYESLGTYILLNNRE